MLFPMIPRRSHTTSTTYRLALASLVCGIVPLGLAVPLLIGRHKPYSLHWLGEIPALATIVIGGPLLNNPDKLIRHIAKAGFWLGVLGVYAVMFAAGYRPGPNDGYAGGD